MIARDPLSPVCSGLCLIRPLDLHLLSVVRGVFALVGGGEPTGVRDLHIHPLHSTPLPDPYK